jgi:hypothetical protein
MFIRPWFIVPMLLMASLKATSTPDTIRVDNGVYGSTNPARNGWEESIIVSPNKPCSIIGVMIYYGAGTGQDEVRITGDASEGTIPPTQYCFSYNTLGIATTDVAGPGWKTIMFNGQGIRIDGSERVVVQHVMSASGPRWGQDNNGQSPTTSYQYDPVSPNPNFFNIPGIYYLAKGDYMVRLIIDDTPAYRKPPTWADVTVEAGLPSGTAALKTDQLSVVDWDRDGYDDLCVAGQFFRNNRNGTFEKITAPFAAGAPTAWADVDNDGDVDCFVAGGFGSEKLWRNDGAGKFTDVTASSGLSNNAPLVTALWFDIENDGDLDLFLGNGRSESNGNEVYFQDKLWRNDGNWKFTDVTAASGIAKGEPAPFFDTWGASLTDYNNDGRTDIFVATYRLAPDRLYRNNGDGTFTEVSKETGTQGIPTTQPQYFGHGMGSEWTDVNNDGNVDLIVGNLGHPDSRAQYSNPSLMLVNGGASSNWGFTSDAAFRGNGYVWHGIAFKEMNAGVCAADFNHDGYTDVWHGQISYEAFGAGANRPAHFYLGSKHSIPSRRRFDDVTWESGMFIHGAWTACRLDYDRDGDMDLVCASGTERVKLFRNDLPKSGSSIDYPKAGSSITVRLRDARSGKNSSGYGARIILYAGGESYMRWLPGTVSGGRMSQMTEDLHVGFPATTIDSIVVHWPGSLVTRHVGLKPHTYTELSSDGKSAAVLANLQPAQINPSHGAVMYEGEDFTWESPTPITEIEIRREDSSKTVVHAGSVSGTSYKHSLPKDGQVYSWRIKSAQPNSQWTPYWVFSVGAPKPSTVQIINPINGAIDIPTNTTVSWTAATYQMQGATIPVLYHVIVATQDTGSGRRVYVDTATSALSLDLVQLPSNKALVCQVTPINPIDPSLFVRGDSAVSLFRTYLPPEAPSLIFPANNATGISTRPRFQWSRPKLVDRGFEIDIDTVPSFVTPTLKKASDTSVALASALKPGRTYYWRARGSNMAGPGSWSETGVFITAGTTDVRDEPQQECLPSRIECYDLRGNLIGRWLAEERSEFLNSIHGVFLLVKCDELGKPCGSELVIR